MFNRADGLAFGWFLPALFAMFVVGVLSVCTENLFLTISFNASFLD
jgi:hypothetical protein